MLTGPKSTRTLAFDDQSADSAPQHQESVRVLLVFGADTGASEFDRWSEARDQPLVVAEQVSRVETFDASLAHDSLDVANAICAGEESRVAIPHEQMRVEGVEAVEIAGPASPFADSPVGHLAQAPDFVQRARNIARGSTEHAETARFHQARGRRELI